MPIAEVADRSGLSAPACYRRIARLRTNGRIEREVAIVSPATMGWPLSMLVLVTLERERGDIIDNLIRRLALVPEVIDIWYVTGEHDFVLRLVAKDMESFDQQTRQILYGEEHVRSFKTLVSMRHAKRSGAIPPA